MALPLWVRVRVRVRVREFVFSDDILFVCLFVCLFFCQDMASGATAA